MTFFDWIFFIAFGLLVVLAGTAFIIVGAVFLGPNGALLAWAFYMTVSLGLWYVYRKDDDDTAL